MGEPARGDAALLVTADNDTLCGVCYAAKKNAAISAQVSLQDSVTGFADVLPIRASAEVSGDGVRGVMAGDQGGLRNRSHRSSLTFAFLSKPSASSHRLQQAACGFLVSGVSSNGRSS